MADDDTSPRRRRTPRPRLTPTLVRLPDDLLDELNRRSEVEDRPMAGIIRLALRRYLDDGDAAATA